MFCPAMPCRKAYHGDTWKSSIRTYCGSEIKNGGYMQYSKVSNNLSSLSVPGIPVNQLEELKPYSSNK